jgi:hypothetical protein
LIVGIKSVAPIDNNAVGSAHTCYADTVSANLLILHGIAE